MASEESHNECETFLSSLAEKSTPGLEYLAAPLDTFQHVGPNGTHRCLVLPLFGPTVSPAIWGKLGDPEQVLRNMCGQVAAGLDALHRSGFCHGDLRPDNIVIEVTGLDNLGEDELMKVIGTPVRLNTITSTDEEVPESHPKYIVAPANLAALGKEYLSSKIRIIDFGEAYPIARPPTQLNIPLIYASPEYLLKLKEMARLTVTDEEPTEDTGLPIGPSCDIWSLGVTLFEMRRQDVWSKSRDDQFLGELIGRLGPLPEDMRGMWDTYNKHFDDTGNPQSDEGFDTRTLAACLEFATKSRERHGPELTLSEGEGVVFEGLLKKILTYNPQKRPSTKEILKHRWFTMEKFNGRRPRAAPVATAAPVASSSPAAPADPVVTAPKAIVEAKQVSNSQTPHDLGPENTQTSQFGMLQQNDLEDDSQIVALANGFCNPRSCYATVWELW